MGVYSDVLAPPGAFFWIVTVVGLIFTFGPWFYVEDGQGNEKKARRRAVTIGIFSFISTVILVHLFGDQRVLSWVYHQPTAVSPVEREGYKALLVPFGVVFWMLVGLVSLIVFSAVRQDSKFSGTATLVFGLLAIQFVTGVPVFPWIVHHWPLALALFASNLLIGSVWAYYEWDMLVRTERVRYDAARTDWLNKKGYMEFDQTLEQKAEWTEYITTVRDDDGKIELRPRYRDHKSENIDWMMLWPVSMFETFLFDVVADVFDQVYKMLGSILERSTARRWEGTDGRLLTPEEEEILRDKKIKR